MKEVLAMPGEFVTARSTTDLKVEPFAASLDDDGRLCVSMRVTGIVERANFSARCKGETIVVYVPAKVERYDDAG
jgi:hypothetical protein